MNFFSELKRRNVLRAGALYAAGAWLLVQVATQVFPFFHVAEWVVRWIIVAAVIGSPFAVAFSWFYEWTPQGIKLESEIAPNDSVTHQTGRRLDKWIIAILSLAVVLLITNQLFLHKGETNPGTKNIPSKSIAVLPFADLSPTHDQELFSEGMAEEILNALARIKNLKVIGRASSFHYKGKEVPLPQIGSDLGVANVLEGSVRKEGDQVRITATLDKTSDGSQIWSKSYDGSLKNIFDLQESFARDIASELNIILADVSEKRLVDKVTDNPKAYSLFVEAQALVTQRVGDSLPRAIELLKEATEQDPIFARAWAKLAVALAVEPQYAQADWETNWNAAEAAIQKATSLDPNSAEAYAALGYVEFSRRHYREMIAPAERAVALDPKDATANFWLANQLFSLGRITDAQTPIDRALVFDPANGLLVMYKASILLAKKDNRSAHQFADRAIALGFPIGDQVNASIDAEEGRLDAGAEAFVRGFGAFNTQFSGSDLATIYRGGYGDETARQAGLAVVAAHPHDQFAATMLIILGEPARSFESFEREGKGISDAYLNWLWFADAWSRKARQDPAFQSFAKRIGMVDHWKQTHWPDGCRPTPENGPDSFTCK